MKMVDRNVHENALGAEMFLQRVSVCWDSMESLQSFGRGRIKRSLFASSSSHVTFAHRAFGGAVGAEKCASQNEQGSRPPADEEGGSQLHLVHVNHRVVEILDDGVGGVADGDEAQKASNDEDNASCDADLDFGIHIFHTVGALAPGDGQQQAEDAQQYGDDDEGAGHLYVRAQSQHGVVDLALHLARALDHAAHPDPLPCRLSCDDVITDEG